MIRVQKKIDVHVRKKVFLPKVRDPRKFLLKKKKNKKTPVSKIPSEMLMGEHFCHTQ